MGEQASLAAEASEVAAAGMLAGFGRGRWESGLFWSSQARWLSPAVSCFLRTQTSGTRACSVLCRQKVVRCVGPETQPELRTRGRDKLALATSVRRAGWGLDLSRRLRDSSINWCGSVHCRTSASQQLGRPKRVEEVEGEKP